jgi:hypothetical protein
MDPVAGRELAPQDALGQRILDLLLDRALERPRAIDRIESGLAEQVARRFLSARSMSRSASRAQVAELDVDDGRGSAPLPADGTRRCRRCG